MSDTTSNFATNTVSERHGVTVLACAPDGPALRSGGDALDVIGDALGCLAGLVVLPVQRLDEAFFTLRTGVAGDVVQKFVNYRVRVAIVGDISAYLEASSALRDFVYESNRGDQLWFLPDMRAVDARLAGSAAPDPHSQ